jgi:hypothetical protein
MTPGQWGKWAFIGLSVVAIVMTAASDDRGGTAKTARVKTQQPVMPDSSRLVQRKQIPSEDAHVELERLALQSQRQEGEAEVGNVFGATSWYVPPPPPPPVKPPPPPKPTAPPMPFTYLGLYEDTPPVVVMLVKGDRVYTVSEGDVIENTYRVEHVAAGVVELIYLPLNIKQSISTGNAS